MMMQSSLLHYDRVLAERYQWVIGCSFEEQSERALVQIEKWGLRPGRTLRAVDLGFGTGAHAAALATFGFERVIAVDNSRRLAEEFRRRCIAGTETVLCDITEPAAEHTMQGADLIVCLGDTLTHLATLETVDRLLARAADALAPSGFLVLEFRDYSRALTGTDRFIPVRADDTRSLTCILDFADDHVDVHDLFWEVDGDKRVQRSGSYRKLRLDPLAITCRLRELTLRVDRRETEGTMVTIVCRKDDPAVRSSASQTTPSKSPRR